ncbi:hypothetical protein Pd630_LPD02469 [Rhodococcus opacus PD630]|nr:hypothetical protein Pd630_LPD02469 [Rhodococcus opacus PD630]
MFRDAHASMLPDALIRRSQTSGTGALIRLDWCGRSPLEPVR